MTIILRMTWKELLRKRVLMLTLLMTAIFLVVFWFIASAIGGETNSSARSSWEVMENYSLGLVIASLGFFFGSFVVAFLAIFSSSSVISGEAELGIMQAMIPRPLARWRWYLGRWLGYVTFGILYAFILFTAILIITNIHAGVPKDLGALIQSYLLFASVVPLLVSVSMLGSSFLSPVGNGVLMTVLYGGGWLGGMIDKLAPQLESMGASLGKSLTNISGLLSLVMPADGIQRAMIDRLYDVSSLRSLFDISADGFFALLGIGVVPSPAFLWYACAYTLAAFLLGIWRFQKKDL